MRVATQTSYLSHVMSEEDVVRFLAEVGYDGIDYSMFYMHEEGNPLGKPDYLKHAEKLAQIAKDSGIKFTQTHATFPSQFEDDMKECDRAGFNKTAKDDLLKSIEITAAVGSPHVVMHPYYSENDMVEKNIEFFQTIEPFAKSAGIKIALENCYTDTNKSIDVFSSPETLIRLIDSLNETFFALLDTGHALIVSEYTGVTPQEFAKRLGKRLGALHVQDNDGIKDLHTLPYMHKINWNEVTSTLKEIGYSGDLTFEADKFLRKFPVELIKPASAFMLAVGRQLAAKASV